MSLLTTRIYSGGFFVRGKIMRLFVAILFLCVPIVAHGATCPAGQYLENGECKNCNQKDVEPVYCPGDDMRHNCPTTNTDYNALGYPNVVFELHEPNWAYANSKSTDTCYSDILYETPDGDQYLMECPYNGENYYCTDTYSILWFHAGIGRYLSGYYSTHTSWYLGTKPCTNAPENAHYTGAGTPDDPVYGGRTDYNDCPWECDDGYGLHDGECVPLCDNGATKFHAGDLVFNIYPIKYGVHNIVIGLSGGQCYVPLVSGSGGKAINININGEIWHTIN